MAQNRTKRLPAMLFLTVMMTLLLSCGAFAAKPVLSAGELTMLKGQKVTLSLKKGKKKIKKSIKWRSSKKSVATVSKKGVVKAKKPGKATITATYKKKKYKCTIRVVKSTLKAGDFFLTGYNIRTEHSGDMELDWINELQTEKSGYECFYLGEVKENFETDQYKYFEEFYQDQEVSDSEGNPLPSILVTIISEPMYQTLFVQTDRGAYLGMKAAEVQKKYGKGTGLVKWNYKTDLFYKSRSALKKAEQAQKMVKYMKANVKYYEDHMYYHAPHKAYFTLRFYYNSKKELVEIMLAKNYAGLMK